MKATTKILALCAALCGMSAWAWNTDNRTYIDGNQVPFEYLTDATTSLDGQAQAATTYGIVRAGNASATRDALALKTKNGDRVVVLENPWQNINFNSTPGLPLNIEVAEDDGTPGSILLQVNANNNVTIESLTGSLSSLIVNGTLAFNASTVAFNIDDSALTGMGPAQTLPTENGYTGKYTTGYVIGGSGALSASDNTTFTLNGAVATFSAGGRIVGGAEVDNAEGKVYYIVDGIVDSDYVTEAGLVYVGPNGTLSFGSEYKSGHDALLTLLAKVRGEGTIAFEGLNLGEITTAYANTGCTLKFKNTQGWITAGSTISNSIVLENDGDDAGLKINGANSWATYTFSGKITGTGDFAYIQTDGRDATFKFTGDLSKWMGSFVNQNTASSVGVTFMDNTSATIAAGVINKATSGKFTATYSNSSKLTVTGTLQNTDAGSLAVSIPSGKTVNFSAAFDDSAITKEGAGTMNLVKNSTSDNHTDDTTFTVSAGTLSIGDSNTDGSAPALGGVNFTVAEGATLDNFGWFKCNGEMTISNDTAVTVFKNGSYAWASPTIEGTGSLVKTGEGTLTLGANYKMDGGITVSAGTLEIKPTKSTSASTISALSGTGTLSLPSGSHVFNGSSTTPIMLGASTSLKVNRGSTAGNVKLNVTGTDKTSTLQYYISEGDVGFDPASRLTNLTLNESSDTGTKQAYIDAAVLSNVSVVVNTPVCLENGTVTMVSISGEKEIKYSHWSTDSKLKLTGTSTYNGTISCPVILGAADASLTCANVTGGVTTDVTDCQVYQSGSTYTVTSGVKVTFKSNVASAKFKCGMTTYSVDQDYWTEKGDFTCTVTWDGDYTCEVTDGTTAKTVENGGTYTTTISANTTITATLKQGGSWTDPSSGKTVDVPASWLTDHGITADKLSTKAANGRTYGENYALNLNPDDEDADFTVSITFDENGNPVVTTSPTQKQVNKGTIILKYSSDLKNWSTTKGDDDTFFKAELSL